MFAHVTTRIEGRKHEGLLSEKGFNGFPSLAALDANGDIIAKLTVSRDLEGFQAMMASGAKFMEVRGKAEKTLDDEVFLLKHDIEMGNADLTTAKDRVAKLEGLSDEQTKEIEGLLTNLEIKAALGNPRSREEFEAIKTAQTPKFVEMFEAGREPTSDDTFGPFFSFILEHAEKTSNPDLFEKALNKLRSKFDNPRNAGFFKSKDEVLAKMRAGGDTDGEGHDGADSDGEGHDDGDDNDGEGHDGKDGDGKDGDG